MKNLGTFEPQIWLEIITSRDAKSTCFKGSQTSCTEMISGVFWPKFGRKRPHHVMDAACKAIMLATRFPSTIHITAAALKLGFPRHRFARRASASGDEVHAQQRFDKCCMQSPGPPTEPRNPQNPQSAF